MIPVTKLLAVRVTAAATRPDGHAPETTDGVDAADVVVVEVVTDADVVVGEVVDVVDAINIADVVGADANTVVADVSAPETDGDEAVVPEPKVPWFVPAVTPEPDEAEPVGFEPEVP